MLSIGTASATFADRPRNIGTPGEVQWVLMNNLVQLVFEAQEKLAIHSCRAIMGNRHLRIDSTPNEKEAKVIALDRADKDATAVLRNLAINRSREAFEGEEKQRLNLFIQHSRQS